MRTSCFVVIASNSNWSFFDIADCMSAFTRRTESARSQTSRRFSGGSCVWSSDSHFSRTLPREANLSKGEVRIASERAIACSSFQVDGGSTGFPEYLITPSVLSYDVSIPAFILRLLRSRKIVRREQDMVLERSSTQTVPPVNKVNAMSSCRCKVFCAKVLTDTGP